MNWIQSMLTLILVLAQTTSKEIESNDITATQTPANLDSDQLRKALLRALTELENEGQDKETGKEEGTSKTIFYSTTARTNSDKIVEKASASAVSFFAKETTTSTTQKPLVVVQKSSGFRPIISVSSEEQNDEGFAASASGGFTDDKSNYVKLDNYKSISKNSVSVNDKSFTAGVKSISITPKPEVTTAIPTSSTEENEAKVEDVQFFSAPLVAAFTVHQDERGLPKKVEPIYKPTATVSPRQQKHELSQQLDLHEKQKLLEQEIFKLQQQKSQQEFLLRHQQLLLQQQTFLNGRSQTERPFIPIVNPIQSTLPTFTTNQFLNHGQFSSTPSLQSNQASQFSTLLALQNNQIPVANNQISLQSTPNQISLTNNQNNQGSNQISLANNFLQNQVSNQNQISFSNNQIPASNNQLSSQNNQISLTNNQGNLGNSHNNQFLQTHASNQNQNKNQFSSLNQVVPSIQLNQFNPIQNQFKHQQSTFSPAKKFNTLVSLQPSLSVNPTSALPLNAQILPIKNAVEFRPVQNYNQFLKPPTQQDGNFGKFQTFQNNFVQSLPQIQHNTRVFRQEPHVGNLGFNQFNQFQNQNQFNQFQAPQQQNPRFFRSNLENFHTRSHQFNQPQNVNQHLNNLLYHSGITRNNRQNDDLNLVSKILSYNVGRDNFFSGSKVSERRVVPKVK